VVSRNNRLITMDKLIEKIVSLEQQGLILFEAIHVNGYAGAAAITTALKIFDGPLNILGGIGVLGLSVYVSQGIDRFGYEPLLDKILKGLFEKGHTINSLKESIKKYPLSMGLKLRLNELLTLKENVL